MYYLCSENKGADQLCVYREADLRLCFRICKKNVFLTTRLKCNMLSLQLLYQKLTGLRTDLSGTQVVPDILFGNKTNSGKHVTLSVDDNSSTNSSHPGESETSEDKTTGDNDKNNDVNDDDNDGDDSVDNDSSDNDSDSAGSEEGSEKKGTIIRPRDESPDSKKVGNSPIECYLQKKAKSMRSQK